MTARALVLLLAFWVIPSAYANPQDASGCGPVGVKFDVKTDHKKQAVPTRDPGKALVFLLQDDLEFDSRPRPTTEFGIDGAWVGATQANSYFYVFVNPGERHLCANWQSKVLLGVPERPTAALHFTAEAGKTYYFRARDIANTGGKPGSFGEVLLKEVDSDEARILMQSFGYSSSHPKK